MEREEELEQTIDELNYDLTNAFEKIKRLESGIKKAREEITKQFVDLQDGSEEWRSYVNDTVLECVEILDKLIAESEKNE